ncbi:MAG: T9SS type A sorting domain-containing protein [candidate division WOR-3 bacterium]|nr:MAG: T9SS type A sorting domain-containing protein [candidate division WOR-3 bacterium]
MKYNVICNSVILFLLFLNICLAQDTGARYLIITHDDYYDALIPLAEWKTQKGLKAKIVRTSETGSDSAQIRSYVANAYYSWDVKPEYLLLVGNKYQIPFPRIPLAVYVYSDNYYSNILGDFRNDIIPGRFWVYDTMDVKTIVAKVLGYEKTPFMADPLWFRKGTTIVNEDMGGIPGDSVYWADAHYAHALMTNAGFVQIDSLARSFGHGSADVINAINNGRSYILYRGEGVGIWTWPFNAIEPENMYNDFKLPVILSATCTTIEGIGQYWLNAGTPQEPRGPVGFYGTSTSLYLAAEMRSALAQGTLHSIFCDSLTTLGSAAEAGRLNYYTLFGNQIEYHSWTCLGDPEMNLWTTTPRQIEVTHENQFFAGICTVNVHVEHSGAHVESALVCAMAVNDSSFYKWGRTDNNGNINLIDTVPVPGDTIFITVTGRNLLSYSGQATVFHTGSPYVLLHSFSMDDSIGGNNDSIINPGENIEIPVWLRNWGEDTACNVTAVLRKTTTDPFFSLDDTIKGFGDIAYLDSAFSTPDGYNIIIENNCPDLHRITLELTASDITSATWNSYFNITVHAPVFALHDFYFPPHSIATIPGNTDTLIVVLQNLGSAIAMGVTGRIHTTDTLMTVIDSVSSFGTIEADSGFGSNLSDPFVIVTDPETPMWHPVELTLEITSGVLKDTFSAVIYVGKKDYLVWDPDPNNSSGPLIHDILDSLGFLGEYSTDFARSISSLYKSLFVCTGVYPLTHTILDTSQAALDIADYITTATGNVYLEGGDVWYSPLVSHGYDFGPLFGIDPIYNSIGTFTGVTGCTGTFAQNMAFGYQGEATMIDYIDSTGGSQLLFKKTGSNYGCGVAANNRTVGLSFELSGLVDSVTPSTKVDLIAAIMNYFGVSPTAVTEEQNFSNTSATPMLFINPNPSRYGFTINLQGLTAEKITLKIYDVSGRCVSTLINNNALAKAQHSLFWNQLDDKSRKVPAGVYFVRLETADTNNTLKAIILR